MIEKLVYELLKHVKLFQKYENAYKQKNYKNIIWRLICHTTKQDRITISTLQIN